LVVDYRNEESQYILKVKCRWQKERENKSMCGSIKHLTLTLHKSIPTDCDAPLDAVGFDIIHIRSEKNRGNFVAFTKAPTRFLQSVSKFIAALKVYNPSVVLC
jgi:hypothetical protein